MSNALWTKTKTVPITRNLAARIKDLETLRDKTLAAANEEVRAGIAKEFDERVQKERKRLANREADAQYRVTVKHIGSADDPLQWSQMRSDYASARNDLEVAARKKLVEVHGNEEKACLAAGVDNFSDAVSREVDRSAASSREFSKYVRAVLVAGLENGQQEYERLYALGGAGLLVDAMAEVRAYQEVDVEMGEG